MPVKRFLLLGLVGALVAGMAVLLLLFNSDLGRFQPQLESYLSKTLDREIHFDSLNVHLGWPIQLVASGVTVANVTWAGDAPLLQIDRLEGSVEFWSLFNSNPVIIEQLDVAGVNLQLAWNDDGANNFQFGNQQPAAVPDDQPGAPVLLRNVKLNKSRLALLHPDRSNHFAVSSLVLSEGVDGMINLDLNGTINKQELNFSGQTGPFEALLAATNVRFEGEGRFAQLDVKGSAHIDSLTVPDRPLVDLQLSGPDIADIERFLGLEPSIDGAFQVNIKSVVEDEDWKLVVDAKAGDFSAKADGQLNGLRDLSRLAVSARANGPNLNALVSLFGVSGAPAESFELSGEVTRRGPALSLHDINLSIGATRLELNGEMDHFPHVQDSQLKLLAEGPDIAHLRNMLNLPGIAEGPFRLSGELAPAEGNQERLSFDLQSTLADLSVNGTLTADSDYVGSAFTVGLSGGNAAAVLERFGVPGIAAAPFGLDAQVNVGEGKVEIQDGLITGLYDLDLSVDGAIAHGFFAEETRLRLGLDGPDLAKSLSNVVQDNPLEHAPFSITLDLQAPSGQILLRKLEARSGTSLITADVDIPVGAGPEVLAVRFTGEGPNLNALLEDRVNLGHTTIRIPAQPWSVAGHYQQQHDRMLFDEIRFEADNVTIEGRFDSPVPFRAEDLQFDLRANGEDLSALLPAVNQFAPASGAFKLDLEGAHSDSGWRFEPSQLDFAGAQLQLQGKVDHVPDFSSTDFSLALNIPSLQALGTWEGKALPDTLLGFNAALSGSMHTLSFHQLALTIDESTVDGELTVDTSQDRPMFNLQLDSRSLDLRQFLPAQPASNEEPAPPSPGAASGGRLFPDTPIAFDLLKQFDAQAHINIDKIQTPRRIVDDLELKVELNDGNLILHRYSSTGLSGNVTASGSVDVLESGGAEVAINLHAMDLVPDREDWRDADPNTLPRFNVSLVGNSSGASLRELAAGLNGRVQAMATKGVLPGRGLAALDARLLERIISLIAPKLSTRQPLKLHCMAVRLEIDDGLARTKPLMAMSTGRFLLQSTGTLNLKTEELNFGFQTTPSRLLGASLVELVNPFVRIEGTMASPRPVIDPTGTLVFGGAAAATGGLSIVAQGLWNRLRGASRPCEHLRDALAEEFTAAKQ